VKHKAQNIYCFDTSALVTMHRYYPFRILPDLWENIEDLFKSQRVRSHQFVYDEIVPVNGPKDDLAKLVSKHKNYFLPISNKQAMAIPEILLLFPHLIDPRSKKNQADPWLIALVIELMEEDLFAKESEFIIVSTESEASPNKIPAVCKHYNIRHMSMFEFFEDNAWKFSLSKR